MPLLKLNTKSNEDGLAVECQGMSFQDCVSALYDIENDPSQEFPIENPETEKYLVKEMEIHMKRIDAPREMFDRLGINTNSD